MEMRCSHCGSNKFYLKTKNANMTGAYCSQCNHWLKWVGKNDLQGLIHRGYKVHPVDYIPETIMGSQSSTNLGVMRDDYSAPPMYNRNRYDRGTEQRGFVSRAQVDNVPMDVYDESMSSVDNDTSEDEISYCPVCNMGTIPLLDEKNSSVILRVVDNVLSVVNKESGEMLAMARVARCPSCGKHLG